MATTANLSDSSRYAERGHWCDWKWERSEGREGRIVKVWATGDLKMYWRTYDKKFPRKVLDENGNEIFRQMWAVDLGESENTKYFDTYEEMRDAIDDYLFPSLVNVKLGECFDEYINGAIRYCEIVEIKRTKFRIAYEMTGRRRRTKDASGSTEWVAGAWRSMDYPGKYFPRSGWVKVRGRFILTYDGRTEVKDVLPKLG